MTDRWTAHYIDDTDGLVHFALEGYPRRSPEAVNGLPRLAHTRCGHLISRTNDAVNAGTFVSKDVTLTCVRCVGGATDGAENRQSLKSAAFAILYGSSMHELSSTYTQHELVIAQGIVAHFGKSLYRLCPRLRMTLFAKAVACSSE